MAIGARDIPPPVGGQQGGARRVVSIFSQPEAESALVATVLADDRAWLEVSSLQAEQFENELYRGIWRLLQERDGRVPLELVHATLGRNDLYSLLALAHPAGDAPALAELVAEADANRRLRSALIKGRTLLEERELSASERLETLQAELDRVLVGSRCDLRELEDGLDRFQEECQWYLDHPGQVYGLKLGFPDLDAMLAGLAPGNLLVVASNTNEGKSMLVGEIARRLVSEPQDNGQTCRVAFFGLEMDGQEMARRFVQARAGLTVQQLAHLARHPEWQARLQEAVAWVREHVAGNLIYKGPAEAHSLAQIARLSRYLVRRHHVQAIIIDYLQVIATRPRDKRADELAEVTRQLKTLAVQLRVPIIAVSQVRREVGQEKMGRPGLQDMADGSTVEKDADYVLSLWRPELHSEKESVRKYWRGIVVLELIKARHREVGNRCFLRFDTCRFDSLDPETVRELHRRYADDLLRKKAS